MCTSVFDSIYFGSLAVLTSTIEPNGEEQIDGFGASLSGHSSEGALLVCPEVCKVLGLGVRVDASLAQGVLRKSMACQTRRTLIVKKYILTL